MTIIQGDTHNNKKTYWKHQSELVGGKTHKAEGTATTGGEPALPIFLLSVWAALDTVA